MTCVLKGRVALVGHLHGRPDPTAHETIHVLTGAQHERGASPPFLPRLPPRARSRSRRDPWRRRRRSSSRRRRSPRKTLPRRARARGRQAWGRGLSPGRLPTSRSPAARPRRPAPRGGSRRSRHRPPSQRVRALHRPPSGPPFLAARPHRRSCGRRRRRLPPRRPLADHRGQCPSRRHRSGGLQVLRLSRRRRSVSPPEWCPRGRLRSEALLLRLRRPLPRFEALLPWHRRRLRPLLVSLLLRLRRHRSVAPLLWGHILRPSVGLLERGLSQRSHYGRHSLASLGQWRQRQLGRSQLHLALEPRSSLHRHSVHGQLGSRPLLHNQRLWHSSCRSWGHPGQMRRHSALHLGKLR